MQRYHNPFTSTQILYPDDQRDYYQMYAQPSGPTNVDRSPFPRMVDFWWAGLSLAARNETPPENLTGRQMVHMTDGGTLDRDSWRVQFIMLISLSIIGDIEIVTRPAEMMNIANGLAAAGVPHVVEMLQDGGQDPIWNLSEALEKMLSDDA